MKSIAFIAPALLLPWTGLALAEDSAIPEDPPPAAHYESLWTKSPFSVATPEEAAESPDYSLAGVMQGEGVAYASIVEKQNSDHFLISSEKANKGMLLKSITHSTSGSDTFATVEKDGQMMTLKLEPMAVAPPAGAVPNVPAGGGMPLVPNIPMPESVAPAPPPGASGPSSQRFMRIHRPTIHLPPQPGQNQPGGVPMPSSSPAPADGGAAPPPQNGANAPTGANGQPVQQVQPHNPPPSQ